MKIGPKIRRLRKLRGLTIEELAENADLTKGFISQLERDMTVPTVVSLKQLLDVLGVDLATFFSEFSERERHIYIKKDRVVEASKKGYQIESLVPQLKYLEMEPKILNLAPGAKYEVKFEEDEGFGFVVKGRIRLGIEKEERTLNRGECFYIFFDNTIKMENLGSRPAEILLVNY
ncbi:MAG TPA: helix-turn-helix domain-containing protein [Calditrichia bacterium]|nr:helix-turn-helix domain-containing protein [Calditrichota bacterium]HQU72274.1 helix-turn-helix domain-containing protein [Calditrichia bacterium]HQV33622.1 helix-turn-helix domain-containing protein [Calditrichia bacterium]